jgi:hypothetical protein
MSSAEIASTTPGAPLDSMLRWSEPRMPVTMISEPGSLLTSASAGPALSAGACCATAGMAIASAMAPDAPPSRNRELIEVLIPSPLLCLTAPAREGDDIAPPFTASRTGRNGELLGR